MPKLERKKQKIFAGNLTPTDNIAVYGSLKTGNPSYSDDVETIQSLSAFENGLDGAVILNKSPSIQDLNALFHVITKQLAYLFQQGIPEWYASQTYYIGSIVQKDGSLYSSKIDSNLNQAVTDTAKWNLLSTSQSAQTNLTVTITFHDPVTTATLGTNYSVTRAIGIYYKDIAGNHRFKFNIALGITIKNYNVKVMVAGVTFNTFLAVQSSVGNTQSRAYTDSISGGTCINVLADTYAASTALTYLSLSGDVSLASKPTWA